MQTSILGIGYAYDSHLSYVDHLRIADSARKSGDVAGEAADRGARRVEAGIDAAASQVTDAVHELSSEVRAARETMEWGFSAVLNEMAEMKTTLKALLQHVREPSQTWAYEQFDIARGNFWKGNYEDCLKRLDYAIDGYQTHLGYPEEWRLHQLKGDIYLQCPDRSLINLPEAEKCFLTAAKYAADVPGAKAMALTAAAVAAYNQGRMELAEKYAQDAAATKHCPADTHFQLARIRLNRKNSDGAWQAALRAIAMDHHYAARLPLDSEFRRNARAISLAWREYAKELRAPLAAVVQRATATMNDVAKSREETNRRSNSRAVALLDQARHGLAGAKARFQEMIELANTLAAEAESSLKSLADGLRANSVFAFLEAEPHAQRANDLATGALAASREAQLTIQKVEELSRGLPPKPKVFVPEFVSAGLGLVAFLAAAGALLNGADIIVRLFRGGRGLPGTETWDIREGIVWEIVYLSLALGCGYPLFRFQTRAGYEARIDKFDWHAANAPQTTAQSDGTILRANEALRRSAEPDQADEIDRDLSLALRRRLATDSND
jgi:hypothetical protein